MAKVWQGDDDLDQDLMGFLSLALSNDPADFLHRVNGEVVAIFDLETLEIILDAAKSGWTPREPKLMVGTPFAIDQGGVVDIGLSPGKSIKAGDPLSVDSLGRICAWQEGMARVAVADEDLVGSSIQLANGKARNRAFTCTHCEDGETQPIGMTDDWKCPKCGKDCAPF